MLSRKHEFWRSVGNVCISAIFLVFFLLATLCRFFFGCVQRKKRAMCDTQHSKKYTSRPSPPMPANECKGMSSLGNDGNWWTTWPDKNGVWHWKPAATVKKLAKSQAASRTKKAKKKTTATKNKKASRVKKQSRKQTTTRKSRKQTTTRKSRKKHPTC
jgi:hypothetical protein